MGYILWIAFTTVVGGFIGNAFDQPYIGIGLGAAVGLITAMLAAGGGEGFSDFGDAIGDAFDD